MSAQGDCEFLVQRARELVQQDLWAAKAWLITARSLYPADFNIQYEMYTIERNAERTATAGRLLYDMFVNFPDQPVVWREISIITSALRNDSQDKQTQFLRSLFETLPGRVQCEMLLKVTEQCFNTLERSEMLLLLLRRFPETVVQHGVGLGEALLEAETIEEQESPVNCFRKLFVCDVLPLIINNHDVRLPANLLYKYLNKAAEFYINYVTRSTQIENQHQGAQETSDLMSPSKRSSQKYIIEGLTEKSSQILDPWERLFKILNVVGMRCEWQMDKGRRSYGDILHRMKDLCRYMNNFDNEAHAKYKNQVVYSTMLVFFKNAFQYVNSIQPSLFQGPNAPSQVPLVLLEDVSNVYGDIEIDRNKHIHKKRKLAEGREKPMMTCEKVLDLMCYMVLPIQDGGKSQEEPSKVKPKFRKGSDLKLLPCTSKAIMPYCLHLMLACFKLRAFTDSRDDMALGHVIVLLQQEWPRGENLFLKAVNKICQQGNFQYENFFNYVTNIDMLEEFAYLRTQEGGKIHLELLPNQGMLIKPTSPPMGLLQQEFLPVLQPSIQTADRHHTVTRGITKGVKEDFRLAMERQVSRCGENLMVVLHRFCINEKILLLQTLA
ncbi:integrator complex subunit 10 isoform X8 [Eptesicus fuscus]|uniref:integrator complex subunit 10 isoform X8 n=1 Tax=Eptesicus fuscus TaxID=29078 RepID=UPI002404290F|nr:integrator complex subunit 10 isoform X8 [Eptesicus fuscus]